MTTPDLPPVAPPDPATPADPIDTGTAADEVIDAEIVPDPPAPAPLPPTPDLTLPPPPAFDYTDDGVPTLDYVRGRIEGKLATAEGWQELEHKQLQAQRDAQEEREKLAKEKLEEIRRSLGH